MNMTTLATDLGHEIPTHLLDAEIPVLNVAQVQGDVIAIPSKPGADKGQPIKTEGTVVVRGENGGNTHALFGDGFWREVTAQRGSLTLGVLTVEEGPVYLHHPEHGYNAFGTGTYTFKRQREQADEIRIVQD
jgi:hypothetical protein